MNPKSLLAALETALAEHRAGKLEGARALYAKIRQQAPASYEAWYFAAVCSFQMGKAEEASTLALRALALQPRASACRLLLGKALHQAGRPAQAEPCLVEATRLLPKLGDAWRSLGDFRFDTGNYAEAKRCYERLDQLEPKNAETQVLLADSIAHIEGIAKAEAMYRRALELNPGLLRAWTNLGVSLCEQGRLSEALKCFDAAEAKDPGFAHVFIGRARAHRMLFNVRESLRCTEAALSLAPSNWDDKSARLMMLNYLDTQSPAELSREHAAFGEALSARYPHEPLTRRAAVRGRDPLRVGFFSSNLCRHSIAWFLEPLLRHLDRDRFHVILFPLSARKDEVSGRLESNARAWIPLHGLSDDQALTRVRQESLDIAVDLSGHEAGNRLALFSRGLAPVQVTYLGYPNTTGLKAMTHRLVDPISDPEGEAEPLATERLLRFSSCAWSYQAPQLRPELEPTPSCAEGPLTFGSFNHLLKLSDVSAETWAELLKRVPGSKLLLKSMGLDCPDIRNNVLARLTRFGIPEDRLELRGRMSDEQEHLALYRRVDIALDPFPYNGTTTTCEALWMGVPVVSLAGNRHAARVGMSLLNAVGHPEWIAKDREDYLTIAARLASERDRLAAIRAKLRGEVEASVLMDHPAQARRFGEALEQAFFGP